MRLIHSEPLDNVVAHHRQLFNVGNAHTYLAKSAGDATTTHSLSGTLYLSGSGWLLLDVPNALVRGAFDALDEAGIELPAQASGSLNAHISVMRPEEIVQIGGPDKITERGHHFHYTLGPIQEVVPDGWDEMSKVWFIKVNSKELQDLRKSYGLSPRPNGNKYDFHITIAVRKKKVLQHNDVAKAAGDKSAALGGLAKLLGLRMGIGAADDAARERNVADRVVADMGAGEDEEIRALQKLPTDITMSRKKRPLSSAQLAEFVNDPSTQELANNHAASAQLSKEVNNGRNYGLVAPLTLGIGAAAAAGGIALHQVLNKEADDGLREVPQTEIDGGTTGTTGSPPGEAGGITEAIQPEYGAPEGEVLRQEEDFECDPEHLAGICNYYTDGTTDNAKFASGVVGGVQDRVKVLYGKLESRYGPTMAKVIIGSGAAGLPIPIPGASAMTAAPALAAGEMMRYMRTPENKKEKKANESVLAADDDEEANKRKEHMKFLAAAGIPLAGGTATALGLTTSMNPGMPVQVTKFPGQAEPWLIRGRIGHDAPASTIDHSGDAYIYAGPKSFPRVHAVADNIQELGDKVKEKLKPDQRLGMLEIEGHGNWDHQSIGGEEGPLGTLRPKTVDSAVNALKDVPWANDANIIGYGCNSGTCSPMPGTKPQANWPKYLSNRLGVNVMEPRGYTRNDGNTGLNQDVHSTGRGDYDRVEGGAHNISGEDYSFTKYSPGKDPEKVVTQTDDTQSKETFGRLPNTKLNELLYGIGKPSALAGTLATPLISDKRTARNVALGASGLAAPMALSEIIARAQEASARNTTGVGEGLMEHLRGQGKALPYAALAGLPIATYGLANLLGRWKDEKKDKKKEEPPDK